jgi:hypothetical protein
MQPGEEIENLVDELEQMVTEAKSPLTGGGQKKIVDAQDVYEILDEIRRVFPQEFSDARRILKGKVGLYAKVAMAITDRTGRAFLLHMKL